MKKISLITIFDVANFGTYLQTLATAVIFQKFGAKVEVVHYERPFKNTVLLRKNKVVRGLYYVYFWLRGWEGGLFMHRCRKFVAKHTSITDAYFSVEELESNPPNADIYVTGSDQVWNTSHNQGVDRVYYLSYAPMGSKKYSYAASIGQDTIPEEHIKETQFYLSKYDAISVRENRAVDQLKEIGIQATQVLDPTLLLDETQWLKYANKRLVSEDYLLVYSVEPTDFDKKISDVAMYIARAKGLKIVSVSNYGEFKRIPDCDIYFDYALPQNFLSLMAYATFVVASSFHGTAFAINFNKPFLTITPGAFSSRIASLLALTGLNERRISDLSDMNSDLLETNINYSKVNDILYENRIQSIHFIKKNILGVN